MTLVLTTSESRPVLGVTFAKVSASAALFTLIFLIYSTINQIRPNDVIASIHDVATQAEHVDHGHKVIQSLPSRPCAHERPRRLSRRVRLQQLRQILAFYPGAPLEIALPAGAHLSCGETLATLAGAELGEPLERKLRHALSR